MEALSRVWAVYSKEQARRSVTPHCCSISGFAEKRSFRESRPPRLKERRIGSRAAAERREHSHAAFKRAQLPFHHGVPRGDGSLHRWVSIDLPNRDCVVPIANAYGKRRHRDVGKLSYARPYRQSDCGRRSKFTHTPVRSRFSGLPELRFGKCISKGLILPCSQRGKTRKVGRTWRRKGWHSLIHLRYLLTGRSPAVVERIGVDGLEISQPCNTIRMPGTYRTQLLTGKRMPRQHGLA